MNLKEDTQDNEKVTNIKINGWFYAGIIILLIALIFTIIVTLYIYTGSSDNRLTTIASIGDAVAGFSALFSAASIFFIISTVIMQKRDLEIASNDFKASITEQVKSNETLRVQQFETSFYNLLNHLINSKNNDAIDSFVYETKNESLHLGHGLFTAYLEESNRELKEDIMDIMETYDLAKYKPIEEKVRTAYVKGKTLDGMKEFLKQPGNWVNIDFNLRSLREIVDSDIPENDYLIYLKSNFEDICERRAAGYYSFFNNLRNNPLESYLEIIVVILEHISKIDKDSRSFYFKVLLSQLSSKDKYVLRFIVYYKLHPIIRNYSIMYPELKLEPELVFVKIL